MAPQHPPFVQRTGGSPARRDSHLRLVRRVRLGVVSAGVLGSLGVAGAVAASAEPTASSTPSPSVSTPTSAGSGDGDANGQWQSARSARRPSPGEQTQQQSKTRTQPRHETPSLQQGYGQAHGSTGGS